MNDQPNLEQSNSGIKLTNAQRVSIRTLQALEDKIEGPYELYPGAEHYEAVWMALHRPGTRRRQFMVAVGGCVSEILR
jgi:hypothetical protein